MPYIQVALDVPLPQLFDYFCADAAGEHVGRRVRVPFGSRKVIGVILDVTQAPHVAADKVRAAEAILFDTPALPSDLLALLRFCSAYYHHPLGEAVSAALPGRFRSVYPTTARSKQVLAITSKGQEALREGLQRAPAAAALLLRLFQSGPLTVADTQALRASQRAVLRRLAARGWIAAQAGEPEPGPRANAPLPVLTDEQDDAVAQMRSSPGFSAWLLQGITGSGKTEVYLQRMATALAAGQVLFLVPEIGLTPQLESHIRARFPDRRLVTLHSGLTATERARHWSAAFSGAARIVLGTRSAVFAPLPELALIVVDEEHDGSYKQSDSLRYSARDLAVWRARHRGVPVVLGSATPSLESYDAAIRGRYRRVRLTRRPNGAALPSIRLVPSGGVRMIGGVAPAILEAIASRVARREQALVFINRRGYAPVLLCSACGWAPGCPRCSTHMVLHQPLAKLLCHHCGYRLAVPLHCAECGNADLQPVGFGTQRIEATLRSALPDSRLLRVDRDTTRRRGAWADMRTAIAQGEVDLLVGTQLLSKGHDFAGLSLVCVLNSDSSLFSTDFRASERLFAQLLQVAGRAGRGSRPGEVLIQTAFPAHRLYQALCSLDYDAFAQGLLDERRGAGLPPFMYQALLRAEAARLDAALQFLEKAAEVARSLDDQVLVYDPTPAAMPRLQGRERAQLLVQSTSRPALHRFLDRWMSALRAARGGKARWALDVDPLDI